MPQYLHCLFTIILTIFISYLLSNDKKSISYKQVCVGIIFQILFAVILFKVPIVSRMFVGFNSVLDSIADATTNAVAFILGGLARPPENSGLGFILAIQSFPVLITISALSAVLTYWKILPFIINIFSLIFKRIFNIGGTLGFAVSANIFSGMSETPLVIKNYLKYMTKSEMFSLLVCGTSAVASSVMVLYSMILRPIISNPLGHIITSVLISIPATLVISRIIIPEKEVFSEGKDADYLCASNTLDALYAGIMDGAKVMITILAMLIGFIAVVDIVNQLIAWITPTEYCITIQKLLGWVMYPVVWIMGVPASEAMAAGSIIGTKIIFNEIIGFQELVKISYSLSNKTRIMLVYSLCSFANISSIGIIIGVYGSLIPERKSEVIKLCFKAIIAGTMVNLSIASIIGVLVE